MLDTKIQDIHKQWLGLSQLDSAEIAKLNELTKPENESEFKDSFGQDLAFGTGGMRGIVGPGPNRLNTYTVSRAMLAFSRHLKKKFPDSELKVAVAYDCRRKSDTFAKVTSAVFSSQGIQTFLFSELTPTPILSYAVRKLECQGGIMLTASHNPKIYNGIKVYNQLGAQVTPPDDEEIIALYKEVTLAECEKLQTDSDLTTLVDTNNFFPQFYQEIEQRLQKLELTRENGRAVKIVFTPLHGTATKACMEMAQRQGIAMSIVEEQAKADSEFSTLENTTPNPEIPEALKLAVDKMIQTKADLVYATDPDCDRLGVVVNDNGIPQYLNGNQIALLMMAYKLKHYPKEPSSIILKSIVTSPLQEKMAQAYEVKVYNTLTGFKWMAHKLAELEKTDTVTMLYSSEESFGYMPFDMVRDKDAVSSIALMNELATYYQSQENKNLLEVLADIYHEFGYAQESLLFFDFPGVEGKAIIAAIMEKFRTVKTDFAGEKLATIKDYLSKKAYSPQTNETVEILTQESNVLGFYFESGNVLYLRPSGTEPKIKFYSMVQVADGNLNEKKALASELIKRYEREIKEVVKSIKEKL